MYKKQEIGEAGRYIVWKWVGVSYLLGCGQMKLVTVVLAAFILYYEFPQGQGGSTPFVSMCLELVAPSWS